MNENEPGLPEITEGTFANRIGTGERRVPCVLLLDTSASMGFKSRATGSAHSAEVEEPASSAKLPIDLLNESLGELRADLIDDPQAREAVDLSVVTFGGPPKDLFDGWRRVDDCEFPKLEPSGNTPLGAALLMAVDMIEDRKRWYRQEGISIYKPWVFILTDGEPDQGSELKEATTRIRKLQGLDGVEGGGKLIVQAVCTDNGDLAMGRLKAITQRTYFLSDVAYKELFLWLSLSLRSVSQSTPGIAMELPEPPPQMTLSEAREIIP